MFTRRPYIIERDSRGRERFVVERPSSHSHHTHHRSSSYNDSTPTTQERLHEAESRSQALANEVSSLQTRLSVAQRDQWHLQNIRGEHQRVVNEHYQCRNFGAQLDAQGREIRRLEELLGEEEERNEKLVRREEKLEEKVRLLKRGSGGEGWQRRYEEKVQEVEMLRERLLEKDEGLRLAGVRLLQKDEGLRVAEMRIARYKNWLREHGFREV